VLVNALRGTDQTVTMGRLPSLSMDPMRLTTQVQMAHGTSNAVRRHYNYAQHLQCDA